MLRKRKKLMVILSIIFCITIAFATNTEKAMAFGGDVVIKDANGSNYTKEMCCQIKPSNNSNGDLIIEGYAFVTYAQQYLSKGTGANNTHSYRLKIKNTNLVYNDVLSGGDNYTSIAEDSTYSTLGTSSTYYCGSSQNYNTQLQQVSFKFIIPASDIASLGPYKDYYKLELECTLKNIKFASTGSTKHTKVINVTKLADANFLNGSTISRDYQTTDSKKRVTVSTSGINYVRVNAVTVRLRNSSGEKTTGYNGGYFVKPSGSLTAAELTSQKNILYEIDKGKSTVSSSYLGNVMYPLKCTYSKTDSYSTSISLEELFKAKPSLKTEYDNNKEKIRKLSLEKELMILTNATLDKCNKHRGNTVGSSTVPCDKCLHERGYYDMIETIRSLQARNKAIESMCIGYNKGSSTTTVNATYYCKSIYLEAAQNVDYYISIDVEETAVRYYVQTQTKKENVNSTTMGSASTIHTGSAMGSVNGYSYSYNTNGTGLSIPKGYHTEVIYNTLDGSKASRPKLPYSRTFSLNKSTRNVVVTVEFRNTPATISRRTK